MPFLDVDGFAALWQPIPEADKPLATLLLEAAERWIREHKPDLTDDDPIARLVTFEVVRAAMISKSYAGHVAYSKGIGPWTKSGTLSNPDAVFRLTDEHYRLLGISRSGEPHWYFGD